MALLIRPATEADIPGILELVNDAILHTTAVYQDVPQTLEMRIKWYHERLNAGYPVIVADADGAFAGFASYGEFRHGYGYRFTVEHSVYVAAKSAGQRYWESIGKRTGKHSPRTGLAFYYCRYRRKYHRKHWHALKFRI